MKILKIQRYILSFFSKICWKHDIYTITIARHSFIHSLFIIIFCSQDIWIQLNITFCQIFWFHFQIWAICTTVIEQRGDIEQSYLFHENSLNSVYNIPVMSQGVSDLDWSLKASAPHSSHQIFCMSSRPSTFFFYLKISFQTKLVLCLFDRNTCTMKQLFSHSEKRGCGCLSL